MQIANVRSYLLFLIIPFVVALVGGTPVDADDSAVLLKGATIHAMDGKDPFVGSILIEDGKIKAIGKSIKAPKSARTINLKGYHVTPGLIDSRSRLWLTQTSVSDKGTKADVDIELGIDPWLKDWQEVASQGITSVYVQPASGGLLGGYGSVLNVGPFGSPADIVFKSKTGLQCSIGLTGNAQSRFAQVKSFEKLLEAAKKELDKEKDADKPPTPRKKGETKKGDDKDESEDKEDKDKDKPEDDKDTKKDDKDAKTDDEKEDDKKKTKDPVKIALKKLLKKEISIQIEVHHADAFQRVLKLIDKYKFRATFDGLTKAGSAADEIKSSNRPLVLGPFLETGTIPAYRKDAQLDWIAEEVNQDGRLWALSGFPTSGIESRMLRSQAALAIRHGVSHGSTLAALTINPARMLGVADSLGSLEKDKVANIAVFAGDPLNPSTPVRMVMCHGKITHEAEHKAGEFVSSDTQQTTDELPKVLPGKYALKSERIMRPDGSLAPGYLVVDKMKVRITTRKPKNTPVYRMADQVITPGLVSVWATLGQQGNLWDQTESDSSHLQPIDAIDPTTKIANKMLEAGVIHIGVAPAATTTSSGALGQLRLGTADYIVNPAVAGQFVLQSSARNVNRYPSSLSSQVSMINALLNGETAESEFYLTSTVANAIAREKQANLEQLKNGKRKTIFVASTDVEARSAVQLAAKHKLKGVLAGVGDWMDHIDSLKENDFGAIVVNLNVTVFDERLEQYVALDRAGIPLALASESAKQLRMSASLMVNAGVDPQRALVAITSGGAAVVGMDDVSLKNGNRADFVIWDGNPLNLSSKPLHVVVDGKLTANK
ncbi:MAG: amidohydrolase family protein [Planctomycetota bacterium]